MSRDRHQSWNWLAAAVLAHLVISVVHGVAHGGAHVPLSQAANLFVWLVVLAGPLVGLLLTWWTDRVGAGLIAVAMAGSFVFGVVNHFVLSSPDHVSHVDPHWQPLFASTAVLLAATEALGSGIAMYSIKSERAS